MEGTSVIWMRKRKRGSAQGGRGELRKTVGVAPSERHSLPKSAAWAGCPEGRGPVRGVMGAAAGPRGIPPAGAGGALGSLSCPQQLSLPVRERCLMFLPGDFPICSLPCENGQPGSAWRLSLLTFSHLENCLFSSLTRKYGFEACPLKPLFVSQSSKL